MMDEGLLVPPVLGMGRSFPRDVEYVLANGRPRPADHLQMGSPGRMDESPDHGYPAVPVHQLVQKAAQVPLPRNPLLPRDGRVEAAKALRAVEFRAMANTKFGVPNDQGTEHGSGAACRRFTGSAR